MCIVGSIHGNEIQQLYTCSQLVKRLKKLEEETKEFAAELDRSSERQEEEFGDLLFAAVNVARKCGIQPELALNRAADKFVRRFCAVEAAAEKEGRHLRELDMEQFDRYWETVKLQEKK